MKLIASLVVIVALISLYGCSREAQDWETAQSANSIEAYQAYIEQYAEGEFRPEAEALIESLRFANAEEENTTEALDAFLAYHPEGKNAAAARQRIEEILLNEAEEANTIAGYQAFLDLYTEGPSADRARELLEGIFPSIPTDTVMPIEGISQIVAEGTATFSAGPEPDTLAIRVADAKIPVNAGMTCMSCVQTIEMAPNLKISTAHFEDTKHFNPTPYAVSSVSFSERKLTGPVRENQKFYIVSGPEGAVLRKEENGFTLISGAANILRGADPEQE